MAKNNQYASFILTNLDDEALSSVAEAAQFKRLESYDTYIVNPVLNPALKNSEIFSTDLENFLAVNNLPMTFDFKALPVLVGTNGDDRQ